MTYSLAFGLVNAANRYLTAEPFRFQVAATGKQLKPRQVWVLQFVTPHGAGAAGPGEGAVQKVHLISALKRYLAADPNGKVTCDQDKPGPQTFFLLHQYPDGKVQSFRPNTPIDYISPATELQPSYFQYYLELIWWDWDEVKGWEGKDGEKEKGNGSCLLWKKRIVCCSPICGELLAVTMHWSL